MNDEGKFPYAHCLTPPSSKTSVAAEKSGWFANEELSGTPHRLPGSPVGLDFPPGTYGLYPFRSVGQNVIYLA